MYSSHLAQAAYRQADAPTRSERGTEYAAFERITARLKQAEANPQAFKARAQAVFENRQLWAILAKDVMDPDNALPPPLRAQIVYLFEFTQVQSRAALKDKASLMPMIEVNTAIMRGLRGEKGTP
ncbi:MAG: flagellar biosynthesis regulator FlaF [Pseudomonadota bacterium]